MSARREKRVAPNGDEKLYWLVDFVFRFPDGKHERIRKLSPVNSRKGAEKFESDLRKSLLGVDEMPTPVESPRLRDFWQTFIDEHCIANGHKHSGVESKKCIFKRHLLPVLGWHRLNEIGHAEIAKYKKQKVGEGLKGKTINNQLSTLYSLLEEAKRQHLLPVLPEKVWVKAGKASFRYLSFDEASALVRQRNKITPAVMTSFSVVEEWRSSIRRGI